MKVINFLKSSLKIENYSCQNMPSELKWFQSSEKSQSILPWRSLNFLKSSLRTIVSTSLPRNVLQHSICLLLSNSFPRNVQHLICLFLSGVSASLPRNLQHFFCLLVITSLPRNVQHSICLFVFLLVLHFQETYNTGLLVCWLALHFQKKYNMLLFVWNNVLFVC